MNHWCFADHELPDDTPVRSRAAMFASRCCSALLLPQSIVCQARTLVQRLYARTRNHARFEYHLAVAALVWVLCKLSVNNYQSLTAIVNVCGRLAKKSLLSPQEQTTWQKNILDMEQPVLVELAFDLSPSLPHPVCLHLATENKASPLLIKHAFVGCCDGFYY